MNMEEITQPEKKDSIKEFIEKAAPYIKKIAANWKKLLIINGIVAVVSAAFLLMFVKNYYDSTITILPDYGASSGLGGLSGLAVIGGMIKRLTDVYLGFNYKILIVKYIQN